MDLSAACTTDATSLRRPRRSRTQPQRLSPPPSSMSYAKYAQAARAPHCRPAPMAPQLRSMSRGSLQSLPAPTTPSFVRSPPPSAASTSAHPRASVTRSPLATTADVWLPSECCSLPPRMVTLLSCAAMLRSASSTNFASTAPPILLGTCGWAKTWSSRTAWNATPLPPC